MAAVVIQVMKPSQTIAAPVTMTLADYLGLTLSQAEIATVLNSMTVEEKIFLQTKLSDGGVTAQEYVDVLKDKYTNAAQSSDGSSNDNSDSQASAGTQTGSNTVGGGASLPPDDDDDKEKSKTDDNSQSSNSSRDNEQFRQDTQDSWDKGSFDSPEGSLDYHFNKHGREVGATTPQQYLRKATEFAKNLKGAKKVDIKGATGNVTRYYKNGKYIDMVGKKIISFGKQ